MAATPSTMLELGTPAPSFALTDTVSGKPVSLGEVADGVALVVMFICNHCPYVKHVQAELVRLARDYQTEGVRFVAISSNDAERYPQDGPAAMRAEAERSGYPFPYLYDETQSVARAYEAACTPDFYVFDGEQKLVYRGQLDDSRPGNGRAVTGADVRAALDAVLAGEPVPEKQTPSIGCNIKWRPGNEPARRP